MDVQHIFVPSPFSSWIPTWSANDDADDASGAVSGVGAVVEVGVGLERAMKSSCARF
jgi:hypothetical protein